MPPYAHHPSAPYQVISQVYQSDDAALQALRQNSQILQPVYSNPELVKESYDGLLAAMGNQADALEIMKQNPAGAMPSALHRTVLCIVRCALPGLARCLHGMSARIACYATPTASRVAPERTACVLSMPRVSAVLTCGGAIAEETPDVRHCGLA